MLSNKHKHFNMYGYTNYAFTKNSKVSSYHIWRSVKVASPHRKSTIYYGLEFWAFFWAPIKIFGLLYFLQKKKFLVEVLAYIKLAPPPYKNLNKLKIKCTRILGFFGLWKSTKTNYQKPPLCP